MEKKMNKLLLAVAALLLIMTLAACGGSTGSSGSNGNGQSSEPAPETNEPEEEEVTVDFPKNPINITVGFPAGGGTDVLARAIAEIAQNYLPNNENFVVINTPGAGGVVALAETMNAKPDGYNVIISPSGPLTLTPHFGDTPYKDLSGITPIINLTTDSYFLAVNGNSPINNFDEFVEYAKNNQVTFGTAGARGVASVATQSVALEFGIELTEVPFEGNAPTRAALMGDHVVSAVSVESDLLPYLESGELKPILYFGFEKHPNFPDVPSVTELGLNAFTNSFFMAGPKDLPAEIRDIIHDTFKQAMEDPAAAEMFEKIMATPDYRNPDSLYELLQNKFDVNKEIIEATGLANE